MEESCKKVWGRWQVSYPWVRDLSLVPIKAKYAERRLIATEQRLLKDPGLAEAYDRQMRDLVKMGFARKLTREEITTYSGPIHYLAHREVCRPDSKSTPLRIVFNCIVLNEFMSKGPDLLNSLWGVLLRFREHSIAISGDKMYHQVSIPHSDQHLHRYMWRDLKISAEPDHYVKTVLTFGDKAAPAMALTALRKTAEGNENQYPGASQTVKLNSYMDDICDSVPTIEQANALIQDIESLLDSGGFHIKRWYSNEKIAAFLVRAKIGLQELWARALEWDEEVPSDLKEKWNAFFEEMRSVKNKKNVLNSATRCYLAIAKSWIKSSARAFKPFVSNRVSEVQGNSDPSEWKYIPGEVNVADDVSRGVSVESLNGRWENGPGFVCTPLEQWPMEDIQLGDDTEEGSKERVNEKFVFSLSVRKSVIDMGTFNSWKKLIRVTAYVLKAVKIFKFRLQKVAIPSGALGLEDITEAERYLILQSQKSLRGKFRNLDPSVPISIQRELREARTESQFMADLPKERLAPYSPPFFYSSCDYFGPFTVKFGHASSEIPSGPFCQTKDPHRRLEFIQKIVDCFWSKWVRDVFPALVPRSKWKIEKRNVRVGDIVVVQDINVSHDASLVAKVEGPGPPVPPSPGRRSYTFVRPALKYGQQE
ncbi:hypothetical protein GQR58_008908 [Nymphon striatum]|nr:hypothetical protein GQR58_008908 [Nymphon striatum]